MAISSAATNPLGALLPEWHLLLKEWSASGRLTSAAQEALLLNGEPQALTDLTTQWSAGDFSGLPPIVLLSSGDINGALGAYAISTDTIYLNADWLAGASKEQVYAVLTEELGHYLDGLLNVSDTPGDEGEHFLKRLLNDEISADDSERLLNENDHFAALISGQRVKTEAAFGSSQLSARLDVHGSWGSSSGFTITVNGKTGTKSYYQNGVDSWSQSSVAAGLRDFINGLDAGAEAAIAIDDPTMVIVWSNVVNGPLSISYSLFPGQQSGSSPSISQIADNGLDDSGAQIKVSAILPSLNSTTIELRPSFSGPSDSENIAAITQSEWSRDGITLQSSSSLQRLYAPATLDIDYQIKTTYLDLIR